jgi:hypothetical protein
VKKNPSLSLLPTMALIVVLIGAGGSLSLVLRAGRHNHSVLLVGLFTIWVLSPFMALLAANVVSKRWPALTRVTIFSLALVLTLGSLIAYSGAWSPPKAKPAGVFLVVPLITWILLAIVIPIAASLSRRSKAA